MSSPPATPPVIEVTDLVKEYRGSDGSLVRAVDHLSLTVAAGEIVGLLGANGAGKTTTLRIIATLLRPTAGHARVCGFDSQADPVGVRRSLGYVSATTGVPDRLTARELLTSFGRLNGLTDAEVSSRVAWLIDTLALTSYADRPAGRLSSGQRQRISLARALVHDPPALVLDEPTNALDVVGSRSLLDTLEHLREMGMRCCSQPIACMRLSTAAIDLSSSMPDGLSRRAPAANWLARRVTLRVPSSELLPEAFPHEPACRFSPGCLVTGPP